MFLQDRSAWKQKKIAFVEYMPLEGGRQREGKVPFFADARANDANVASVISNEHGADDVRLIYARIVLYCNGLKVPIDSVRGTSRGM